MEKKYKNGLCLGKFMPVHNGHIHMVREAAKQCETVHVLVCSRLCEPISGIKRFKWISEIFNNDKNINVILCEDENPQYPEDDDNFYDIWNDSVFSRIANLDAVFASEDYVYRFAEALGVEPVMVDRQRKVVPVSATAIRSNPFDNWEHIPDVVKEQYRLKIAVVGPESSGKTTLCDELHKHFGGINVAEFGREYTNNVVDSMDLEPDDFKHIAILHHDNMLMAEYDADKDGSKYIFIDTEAIVTRQFLNMYADLHNWYRDVKLSNDVDLSWGVIEKLTTLQMFGEWPNYRRGKVDLYLLMYPDLEWEDDGTRDFEDLKDRINSFNRIKEKLDSNGCNYRIVKGVGQERLTKAITLINNSEKELREKEWHKLSFDR